jgi:hypothetical protein
MKVMNIEDTGDERLTAFDTAISNYIRSRKKRVPDFVKKHFSFKGALHLNKETLGADLYKTPLNVAWSIPYLGLRASSSSLKKLGLNKITKQIDKIPSGFETRVQKEINWLIFTELLELPYCQNGRTSLKDALLTEILNQPKIISLFSNELSKINAKSENPGYRAALEKNLMEYAKSRTAAADLAGNIIALSAGATAFGKMTPGSLTAGNMLATIIAHKIAVSNFILGPTLGGLYYAVFPAAASTGLIVTSTGAVVLALAVLTSFSSIISDPIQSKLGIHQRRLLKLIDSLEGQLRGIDGSQLKIRDQYYARVFDLFDLIKRAAQTFV